ncbi:helix-turn-helix transcriptional regulator [Streptomyces albogriseolus]|uniref:helix-turn-helix transcriptional regulator n=1 Tax=Streptomyces TaxID=1883 RepID=UPI001F6252DE|nr:helix-turn-helix transcriptional regulator [Streptomyces sp. MMS20-AI2-20]MCI4146672.1 helix-turn-helix transcriptional regulator [Streptomyces sp. MMS20-AI2-20]
MNDNGLGRFLRARRERVRPEDVGLPATGRRRVPGLRREELALLAGISAEYYLRLEQGRDHNPSPAVLDALARVLLLDDEATAYLHALAGPGPRRRARRPRPESVPPGIHQLMTGEWSATPIVVLNKYMDVLAANALATALSPVYTVGTSTIRAAFLDEELRSLYTNREEMTVRAVAGLRALIGPDTEDPRVVRLVHELSTRSEEFRQLWARHDVGSGGHGASRLNHPVVGTLDLSYDRLAVPGSDGQLLVVHHAVPGSDSARKLTRLYETVRRSSASAAGVQR